MSARVVPPPGRAYPARIKKEQKINKQHLQCVITNGQDTAQETIYIKVKGSARKASDRLIRDRSMPVL